LARACAPLRHVSAGGAGFRPSSQPGCGPGGTARPPCCWGPGAQGVRAGVLAWNAVDILFGPLVAGAGTYLSKRYPRAASAARGIPPCLAPGCGYASSSNRGSSCAGPARKLVVRTCMRRAGCMGVHAAVRSDRCIAQRTAAVLCAIDGEPSGSPAAAAGLLPEAHPSPPTHLLSRSKEDSGSKRWC
jgi:hypothetical protein